MRRVLPPAFALAAALGVTSASAQPRPNTQDELDLTGLTSLFVGAGARAYGMGGAFLARADDATAASWNPAGLSYLRHPEVTAVGVRNVFNIDSTLERIEASRFKGAVFDFAAVTYPLKAGGVTGAAQVSYQRAIPFSGSRVIRRDGVPNPIVTIDASGGYDVLTLGTGWKLTRRLRLGVALNRWLNGYEQLLFRQPETLRARDILSEYRINGWNFNVGVIWSPLDSLNVGLVGKTPFTAHAHLSKARTDYIYTAEGALIAQTTNEHASDDVRIDLPGGFGAGLSWRPRSQLTLSADYTRTLWSDTRIHNYFDLPFTSPDQRQPAPPIPFPTLYYPNLTQEPQQDAEQIRLGVEYVLLLDRLKIPLRAGYLNDRQIVLSQDGSAPRFNGVTVGTGIVVGPILLDLAYLYESGEYVATDGGRHSTRIRRFFASLIYRHRGLP